MSNIVPFRGQARNFPLPPDQVFQPSARQPDLPENVELALAKIKELAAAMRKSERVIRSKAVQMPRGMKAAVLQQIHLAKFDVLGIELWLEHFKAAGYSRDRMHFDRGSWDYPDGCDAFVGLPAVMAEAQKHMRITVR